MEVAIDRLYKRVIGSQKAGAPSLMNHAGSESRPVAVIWSLQNLDNWDNSNFSGLDNSLNTT